MIVGEPCRGPSLSAATLGYDRSIRYGLGTKVTDKAALHKEMLCCITDFENLMAEVGDILPPITREDVLEIKEAIAILKALPARPMPVGDYIGAMVAETTLNRIAFESAGLTVLVGFALMRLARSVTNWLH
jgi:hypothetical protein